jgi:hypothetical protein
MEAHKLNPGIYKPRDPKSTDYYQIIRKNYLQIFYEKEINNIALPFHLKREFSKFLSCGILAHGFARFHCGHCQKDKLVAYSCKGRTVCPSCTGRRMADSAKHLVENVIPDVPVRQWVLSLPYKHRFILSSDKKLLSLILGIYHRAISGFYKKKAKQLNLANPKVGAISVVQRFGGALNLNVHFHTIFMDGIYFENSNGIQVFKEIIPSNEDIFDLIKNIKIRINRCLDRHSQSDHDMSKESQLSLLKSESIQNRVDGYNKPTQIGKWCDPPFEEFKGRRCAYLEGFSLHANVKIPSGNRSSLERLCRYISRGPIAKERISKACNGNILLKLKTPYTDGTTHLQFTPDQFIKRLIALIPPPRLNLIRYYGVFGARHQNRKEITTKAIPINKKSKKSKSYRTPWAELLKRVFLYDVTYCDHCGNKLTLIASLTNPAICKKILDHLNLDSKFSYAESPRAPPEYLENQKTTENLFSQEINW